MTTFSENEWTTGRVEIEKPGLLFRSMRYIWPWAWRSYGQKLGLRNVGDLFRHWWLLATFDRRFRVRTNYLVPIGDLEFRDATAQAKSARYRGTPPLNIMVSLERLSERLGGLDDQILIDYGCGAGRVLILAAEAGLKRSIGVELSPHLFEQCRKNIDSYCSQGHERSLEVLQTDAARFAPPPDATIFYFFSPFHISVFEDVLEQIRASVREHPRDVWFMIFMAPHFPCDGLTMVSDVTGVQTWTNAFDPASFLAGTDPR